jgi:hypothetical protein
MSVKKTVRGKVSNGTTNALQAYKIADGVKWVNGQNVEGKETIRLTHDQAIFDQAQGRISLMAQSSKK